MEAYGIQAGVGGERRAPEGAARESGGISGRYGYAFPGFRALVFIMAGVLFLFFLTPRSVLAAAGDENNTQKINRNVPKTAEEFLIRLKMLMEQQNIGGFDFAEKMMGVDRGKFTKAEGSADLRPYVYGNLGFRNFDPSIPYSFNFGIGDDREGNFLLRFQVSFNEIDQQPVICITQKAMNEIFGEPLRTNSLLDNYVGYQYEIDNYAITFRFNGHCARTLQVIRGKTK